MRERKGSEVGGVSGIGKSFEVAKEGGEAGSDRGDGTGGETGSASVPKADAHALDRVPEAAPEVWTRRGWACRCDPRWMVSRDTPFVVGPKAIDFRHDRFPPIETEGIAVAARDVLPKT